MKIHISDHDEDDFWFLGKLVLKLMKQFYPDTRIEVIVDGRDIERDAPFKDVAP